MIKAEVVFDGDAIEVNGRQLMVNCSENGTWYVEINGNQHNKTLEQAISHCLENRDE